MARSFRIREHMRLRRLDATRPAISLQFRGCCIHPLAGAHREILVGELHSGRSRETGEGERPGSRERRKREAKVSRACWKFE